MCHPFNQLREVAAATTSSLHRGSERLSHFPKPTQLVMWQSWHFGWACAEALPPPPPLAAANLQSPYGQAPCVPLYPRLDKKMVRRKQGSHYLPDQGTPTSLGPDTRGLFLQSGFQGSRWVSGRQVSSPGPSTSFFMSPWPNPRGTQPSKRWYLGYCCSREAEEERMEAVSK